jgi:hypothetical protein
MRGWRCRERSAECDCGEETVMGCQRSRFRFETFLIVQRTMSMSTAAKTRLVPKRPTAGMAGGWVSFT